MEGDIHGGTGGTYTWRGTHTRRHTDGEDIHLEGHTDSEVYSNRLNVSVLVS